MIKSCSYLTKDEYLKVKRLIDEDEYSELNGNYFKTYESALKEKDTYYVSNGNDFALYYKEKSKFDKDGSVIYFSYGSCEFNKFFDEIRENINNCYIFYNDFIPMDTKNNILTAKKFNDHTYPIDRYIIFDEKNINKPLNAFLKDYIPKLDSKDKVKYRDLNIDEFRNFILNNYYHNGKYKTWINKSNNNPLIGLHYTFSSEGRRSQFNDEINNCRYLVSYVPNKKGKKTLISVIKYLPQKSINDETYSYIVYLETNHFYRNMGFMEDACSRLNLLPLEKDVVLSFLSKTGKMFSIDEVFKKYLSNYNVYNEIEFDKKQENKTQKKLTKKLTKKLR